MPVIVRAALALIAVLAGLPASANFHLWQMDELYSNADGSVQFLELTALEGGQEFVQFHTLTAGGHSFTFPSNLPGDTAGHRMLIGTQGFAALGVVTPNYIVPNGFFPVGGGTINFAEFADVWTYPALPSPALSLNRDGSTATNSPRNFAGQTGTITTTAPPPTALNFQALWWRSPAGSENGWGLNVTHQGDALFVTWFTYDLDGSPLWFVMDNMQKVGNNQYFGNVYRTHSSPFSAYDGSKFAATLAGTATLSFSDANTGTFQYTIDGVAATKPITKFLYSSPVPTCATGAGTGGNTVSYQDMLWKSPAGSENGWGVNVTHQGDTLFATWFTYGADGSFVWFVMDNAVKTAQGVYSGNVYQPHSAPYNNYDGSKFGATQVGTATFTFTDPNNGTFSYTVNGISQTKAITRYVFSSQTTSCSFSVAMTTDPMYPMDPYMPYPE